MSSRSPAERGFTLIELLVALAVFSLAAMALLNVAGENTRTAGVVATRVLAEVVAENQAAMVMTSTMPLQPGAAVGAETQGGRLWRWRRVVTPTSDAGLMRVDFAVTPDGSARTAAELTIFRSRR